MAFFFSSRRRHTRWPRDWSSDVCSSDLPFGAGQECRHSFDRFVRDRFLSKVCNRSAGLLPQKYDWLACDTTPGRQDGCMVVIGKILEKTIDPWFIPICFDHSGLHVIGNEHFRDAAGEAQSALDCGNHILSLLRAHGLHVAIAAWTRSAQWTRHQQNLTAHLGADADHAQTAQHCANHILALVIANGFNVAIVAMTESEKQNPYLINLTSNRIHIFSVLAGKIDINLLSGGMGQIRHRQIAGLVELLQVLAKMTVTEAAGMVLPILTPQQPACDPFSAQLATEVVIMINKNLVAFGW